MRNLGIATTFGAALIANDAGASRTPEQKPEEKQLQFADVTEEKIDAMELEHLKKRLAQIQHQMNKTIGEVFALFDEVPRLRGRDKSMQESMVVETQDKAVEAGTAKESECPITVFVREERKAHPPNENVHSVLNEIIERDTHMHALILLKRALKEAITSKQREMRQRAWEKLHPNPRSTPRLPKPKKPETKQKEERKHDKSEEDLGDINWDYAV